jgi:hypothetical protein
MTLYMIKTMSIFENIYLVESDEKLTIDAAQSIVDDGTVSYYQHFNGELVKTVEQWSSRDKANEWLHENDYY